ncbi:MAG TPA: PAS domain-containing sensor histidine kinase [Pyrinomonadaceae bacterium]
MNEDSEKEVSKTSDSGASSVGDSDHSRMQQLIDARRAAVNLMEDAVVAKERSDELVEQLRGEIAARKDVENELKSSRERLELLTESFQDFAIFTMDVTGKVVTWNPGAEAIFGYSEGEILGRSGRILFVPEDQEKGEAEREMETARTLGRAADERWHLRKDGWRFYASGIMAPLYEGSELIGFAKIARDLTAQKESEEMMRRHRDELERVVRERTEALEKANEALRKEIQERRTIEQERFALMEKIVTTQEDERRRIARDMHDSLGQQLTALRLKLASLKEDPPVRDELKKTIEHLQQLGAKVDAEVNFLVWELRPTVLDDLGLIAAIENYAREWSRHYGISAEFHAARLIKERLDQKIETHLYRILQEALNNTYKHARAQSVNIVLENRGREIVLVVEDDGVGFDADAVKPAAEPPRGLGLIGMRERAAIIGGTIEIESSPGKGTTVFVRVPIGETSGIYGR